MRSLAPPINQNACDPLTGRADNRKMIDCDDLIDGFHQLAREQVNLALIANVAPVAAMHIDLARFGVEQARFAERLCENR